ncbi:MAG: tetraacyldisaccharide 4'-kinase [Pseudomonadota bacterium]
MRAPKFWSNPPSRPGLAARLLWPASLVYAAAGAARLRGGRPHRPRAPVICVGNLVAGGAGKTPTVLALCARLAAHGLDAHVLTRGYGGKVRGPHRVDPERDTAEEVGDEALLLAQRRPTWVGADREASAIAAVLDGAEILVMDDGFQNPSIVKDLSFLVVDAGVGHGNGRVIPAGPLREPLRAGFARASAAVLIGDPADDADPIWFPAGLPVLKARLSPLESGIRLSGERVVAFAGIGRPRKFFDTLRSMGAEIVSATAFPDHHRYSTAILQRLEMKAHAEDAMLVTTEKDAVRFPAWFRGRAIPIPVMLGFEDPLAVDALLDRLFETGGAASGELDPWAERSHDLGAPAPARRPS